MAPLATFAAVSNRPATGRETLTRNQAASRLGLSLALVDKLMRAGVLETPIRTSTVDALSARPQLEVVEGELTVLRTDSRKEAYPGENRNYIGFHVDHTDLNIEETSLRWWRSDPERVLDNELFAVTVSTIPVAVFHVTKHLNSMMRADEDAHRHQYAGQLLARAYAGMASVPVAGTTPGHLRERVEQIMTSRITVSSGGPIGYLEPNLA